MLSAHFRSLLERKVADRAEVIAADPLERSNPRHWPTSPDGAPCPMAQKNCRLASLREHAFRELDESHAKTEEGADVDEWIVRTVRGRGF